MGRGGRGNMIVLMGGEIEKIVFLGGRGEGGEERSFGAWREKI